MERPLKPFVTLLAVFVSLAAHAGGGGETKCELECAQIVSEAVKSVQVRPCPPCPQACPTVSCPTLPCPACPACICEAAKPEQVTLIQVIPDTAPTWYFDVGAQWVDDPGVFVGPRRQWASGVSLAIHAVFEKASDGRDGYTICPEGHKTCKPHYVEPCRNDDRVGVAVMFSFPLSRKGK